jgi:hypothetical protein
VNLVVKTRSSSSNLSVYGGAGPSVLLESLASKKVMGIERCIQEDGFKRFDFGVNLTAGITNRLAVQLHLHPG